MGDNEYYDILEINKKASQSEIRKAYYKLAKEYHPDKAPTDKEEEYTEKFQKISFAYETLSDEEKRKTYDRFGKDGIQGSDGPNINPFDIFSQFFGTQGFSFGNNMENSRTNNNNSFMKKRVKKSAPVVHQVNLTLEDLFKGKTVKLKITKKTIFRKNYDEPCDLNELESTWMRCNDCNGQGARLETRQVGPGFITQTQIPCRECLGTGNVLLDTYELREYQDTVKVAVKRGMDPRNEHVIEGGGNCYPGTHPGDIVIAFNIESHKIFKLRGNNLTMFKKILLSEALCGMEFNIVHLDNSILKVKVSNIIKPGTVKTIKGEGMYDKFGLRGDLVIQFDVEFPETLLIHQKKNLKKYLPKPNKPDDNKGGEVITI